MASNTSTRLLTLGSNHLKKHPLEEKEKQELWKIVKARITDPVFEDIALERASPLDFDMLLGDGWWDYGSYYCRHNFVISDQQVVTGIYPLRVDLRDFSLLHTKSLRKIVRRCQGFRISIGDVQLDAHKEAMYMAHRQRFNPPYLDSLAEYLSAYTDKDETTLREFCVYDGLRLIACSYLNVGQHAASSLYAIYDLDYQRYSLGIYTMIMEAVYGIKQGLRFFYPGYCFDKPSSFDYKRRLPAIYYYDWATKDWLPIQEDLPSLKYHF